jgi:hypothetical protein
MPKVSRQSLSYCFFLFDLNIFYLKIIAYIKHYRYKMHFQHFSQHKFWCCKLEKLTTYMLYIADTLYNMMLYWGHLIILVELWNISCLFYSLFYLHKCMILWNGLEIIWISLFYSTFPFQKDKTNVCSLWFKKQSLKPV